MDGKKIVLFLSLGLFVASLTQQAYCTSNLCRSGLDALVSGFFGFWSGEGATIIWIANPILFLSWIFFKRRPQMVLFLSLAAMPISLSFLLFKAVLDNEAGHLNPIIERSLGYWLWVASSVSMFTGNMVLYLLNRNKTNANFNL
jgi:hypothetical protein